jgi:hypothetical protein
MIGICSKAVIALTATLCLVSAATAASPDVSAMNLQATDVPGAKIATEGARKEKGYVAAYLRSFEFSAANNGSRLVGLEAETRLASSASTPTSEVSRIEKQFRSAATRKRLIAQFAKASQVKPKAVTFGALRRVPGYDQGFELPVSLPVAGNRLYESLVYVRLDRVEVIMLEVGLRPIRAPITARYTSAIAGHIGDELAPVAVSPPTVTGTAVQGQTLAASPGAWSAPDATFTYQWQHCDAAGATCADIAGATGQTYGVTAADVGATLVVVVKATNRFGSPTAPSVATAVVS